jgi:hypothetical protein
MDQGNLGDLGNLDVATLLQYLPGGRFPAEKEPIASTAEGNGAENPDEAYLSNAGGERTAHGPV